MKTPYPPHLTQNLDHRNKLSFYSASPWIPNRWFHSLLTSRNPALMPSCQRPPVSAICRPSFLSGLRFTPHPGQALGGYWHSRIYLQKDVFVDLSPKIDHSPTTHYLDLLSGLEMWLQLLPRLQLGDSQSSLPQRPSSISTAWSVAQPCSVVIP